MLDDLPALKKRDAHNMLSHIEALPEQMIESRELTKELGHLAKPNSIVVLGMGGSGIAGDILHDWLSKKIKIPITINKNLSLPEIDDDTMLMALSYSGNTKETLLALEEGLNKTNNIVCVTSGGELLAMCLKKMIKCVNVPSGYPPRCALGYLFGSLVHVLKSAGVYDGEDELEDAVSHLKELRTSLIPSRKTANNLAKKLAHELQDYTPIVYAYDEIFCCARRWQTALNENSKVLSWCSAMPEMSHNEILGWDVDDKAKNFAMVFLRDMDEPEYIKNKFEAIKRRVRCKFFEVWAQGKGRLSRIFHLIYTGDFVSYYLAILRGVDPMPVKIIEELKRDVS